MSALSPLRYPGGKQIMAPVLSKLMEANDLQGASYGEAYAGGAGAALSLLFGGYANRIFINDADPAIAAMWTAIVYETNAFAAQIRTIPLNVSEWRLQKQIYLQKDLSRPFLLGFAAFYLNRVNRSGIIKNAGPIGGMAQLGRWKIDARFNREALVDRVLRIGRYRRRISVTGMDALQFLEKVASEETFIYLDPPYYVQGPELYLSHYKPEDHQRVADCIQSCDRQNWILSYDDVPQIRKMYKKRRKLKFDLSYSVRERRLGKEILVVSDRLNIPSSWFRRLPL